MAKKEKLVKLTTLIFLTKFALKGNYQLKAEKVNTAIRFCIIKLVCVSNFSLNWWFWFLDKIYLERVFPVENKKWTSPLNWILHIWIKFQLKLSNLNQISAYTDNLDFSLHWQMFPKMFFWSKIRKVKITIEFWISEFRYQVLS